MKIRKSFMFALTVAAAMLVATDTVEAAATPAPDVLYPVDASSSAGSVVDQSDYLENYPAGNAFDGVKENSSRWLARKGDHMYFVYRFNAATKVNAIRICIPGNNYQAERAPKDWKFYGSDDNVNWQELDSRSGQTSWTTNEERLFDFNNGTAYQYYKFDCTANNGNADYMMLWEIEFLASDVSLTDLTTGDSGAVSSSSATHADYPASKAFDGNRVDTNGRWLASKAASMNLVYQFNTATAVNAIRIWNYNAYTADQRAPKAWTFSGSNDGESWDILDEQTSETGWSDTGEARFYQFNNKAAYEYYKFDCTELCDASATYLQIWEIEFYFVQQDGPSIGDVSLARTGAATYAVAAEIEMNGADTVSWIAEDVTSAPLTNSFATAVAEGSTANGAVSGLAADKTWKISVFAENAAGSAKKEAGVIYTGELALGATTDANEYGLSAGGVVVSRANADPWPLTVNYTIATDASGVAAGAAEGTTWVAPAAVTIPEGSASAVLPVVPLMDGNVTADVAITVALAAGNYEIPAVNSANLTLVNLVVPEGKKTWVAAADGNASNGANWLPSGAPTASDDILFDGNFSNAQCTWDAAATHTVASWTQAASYNGMVTFPITYEGADVDAGFNLFTVTGDVELQHGHWVHPVQGDSSKTETEPVERYRLNVQVGGNFAISNGVNISAQGRGRGFWVYNSTQGWFKRGVYAGYVITTTNDMYATETNPLFKPFGSILAPVHTGKGITVTTDNNAKASDGHGGGAITITVEGDFVNNGAILAKGQNANAYTAGSGGSIFVTAANILGSGSYEANATATTGSGSQTAASGGRVSLVATGSNVASATTATANGSRSPDYWQRNNDPYWQGAAGTVWLKSGTESVLLVRNVVDSWSNSTYYDLGPWVRAYTPIPANDDAATFKAAAKEAELYAASNARIRLEANAQFAKLKVRTESASLAHVDLHGKTLRVDSVADSSDNEIISTKGTYTLADATANGWAWFEDSVGGGKLVVGQCSFIILVR